MQTIIKTTINLLSAATMLALVAACGGDSSGDTGSATPTPTSTPMPSPSPVMSPSPTPSASPMLSPSPSPMLSPSPSPSLSPTPTATPPGSLEIEGYTLIWQDEFNGPNLDTSVWNYRIGDGCPDLCGWGNQEEQEYSDSSDNVMIGEDAGESVLMITAREDGAGGYTSGRINTNGTVSVRYGKVVARIKIPTGQGLWPAFWMLGDNNNDIGWPYSGEIDIMENVGHLADETFHTLHWYSEAGNPPAKSDYSQEYNLAGGEAFADSYHIFELDWDDEFIRISVDGNQAYEIDITPEDMLEFQRSFYMILNVAVGGTFPGPPDETTVFPQTMYVDYVRVYEQDGYVAPAEPAFNEEVETAGSQLQDIDPSAAVQTGFSALGAVSLERFGAGGEPQGWSLSDDAVDGETSVLFDFPGGAWGGAWLRLESPVDLSSYTNLVFALKRPAEIANIELKLESSSNVIAGSINLDGRSSTDLGNGWEEFTLPLADFACCIVDNQGNTNDLDLTDVSVPFAIWNPADADGAFPAAEILFDNIRFE